MESSRQVLKGDHLSNSHKFETCDDQVINVHSFLPGGVYSKCDIYRNQILDSNGTSLHSSNIRKCSESLHKSRSVKNTLRPIYIMGVVLLLFFVNCIALTNAAETSDAAGAAKPKCQEYPMNDRNQMADVIVSGMVQKLEDDEAHSTNGHRMLKGKLQIHRIFKGTEAVNKISTLTPGLFRPLQTVMVEGFGDSSICDNMVKERETKIFLLVPNGNRDLRLNSSVMALTMTNLDYVDAVVKGIPYTKPTQPDVSPCFLHFCPFGATCRVNESSNTAMCMCEQKCGGIFAPVCGSDDATYSNLCSLNRATCIHGKRIRVKGQGECGVQDPCEARTAPCEFGAECLPSIDGKTSRCQCPTSCPSYGDNLGSKPVCGNDGNDYRNVCELHKASCERLTEIRVKYYGKCDPCEDFKCDSPKVCQISKKREPECRCNYHCFDDISLVCGTDGHTYSNQCVLKKQACKSRKDIRVHKPGKCTPDNNPCSKVRCGPAEECMVDNTGRASCECPSPCEPVLRRVCGNDSKTYDNECELRRRTCMEKEYVIIKHAGDCYMNSPCSDLWCDYGAVCMEKSGVARCVCPQCSEEYSPVCGTNGITYENECKLRQENCQREETVKVDKRGPCDDCGQSRCEFYSVCQRLNGKPTCVCPTSCVTVHSPVCGNDDVTYSNECDLRVQSCQRKIFLTIVSTGTCDTCRGINCQFGAKCESGKCVCPLGCPTVREPVCASDDRTYGNECEMRRTACTQSVELDIVRTGECEGDDLDRSGMISGSGDGSGDGFIFDDEDVVILTKPKDKNVCSEERCIRYGGTCEMDNVELKCSCKFVCPSPRAPVCGSDGITYGNKCMMLHQSCIRKQLITEQSMDNCDEFDEDDPCQGSSKPLVNPGTRNDYDCSAGREQCPTGSYCHMTSTFSKCCKKENSPIVDCTGTEFGCCKDGKTPANGPRQGGCPDVCHCHPMGSFSTTCDPRTKQCPCKPGVGGKMCDRCDVGYWGLHRIELSGYPGCIPCNCNKYGSYRDDCEQTNGRCVCKNHVTGMRCDTCQNGNQPGPDGCSATGNRNPLSCADVTCQYGAVCRDDSHPVCVCDYDCDSTSHGTQIVCGTNNTTYGSRCQAELFRCRQQKDIRIEHIGPCKGEYSSADSRTGQTTHAPAKSRKTTRHISGGENDGHTEADGSQDTRAPDTSRDDEDKATCEGSHIEDLCVQDEDCCPSNSYCRGLCYCEAGYIPSVDNKECYVVKKNKEGEGDAQNTTNACTVNPCLAGSKCIIDEFMGFRCACPLRRGGTLCNKDVYFSTPSFSGRSHLEFSRIDDASQDVVIDVVFSSLNKDAIILFNAKFMNGSGDFVSITMKDGYIEFRYDLGAGPAVIRSREPVELIQSHRIIARRTKSMGELIVNGKDPVKGRSPGSLTSLDLNDPLFMGYLPYGTTETFDRIGVSAGLVGCIYSLRAGNRNNAYAYALHSESDDIIRGIDIIECGKNPCKSMPCKNGGACLVINAQLDIYDCLCRDGYKGNYCEKLVNPCAQEPCQYGGTCIPTSSTEGFFCQCPHGREGMQCEKESIPQVFVPQFTGDSYMEMPLEERISNSLSISVWFKALKPNGVIFFATQNPGGRGDFIALNLRNKKLIFTFFLGSDVGVVESLKHIRLDKWHEVTVTRNGKDGQMKIDGHPPVIGQAKGSASMLNIDNRPLYVGGFRDKDDLPSRANIENGLTGAIQRLIINGRTIDGLMATALSMRNISAYNGAPCNVNPCMNGGVCIPKLNAVECRCPVDYMGDFCDKRYSHVDRDQPIAFEGMTYISYPNEITRKQEGQQSNQFKVKFRTTELDGILLLQIGGDTVSSDYLSLAISDGFPEFSYNLGKQGPGNLHLIRSTVKVNDGDWHEVIVTRRQREGTIKVDDEEPVMASSGDGTRQLDTDGLLWVGGRNSLPWGLPTMKNFVGCIDTVEVNGIALHLVEDKDAHSTSISFCSN